MTSFYPPLKKIFAGNVLALAVCAASTLAQGQTATAPTADTAAKLEQPKAASAASPKTTTVPAVRTVRDVQLGMSLDDVKKKLGKPDVQDDTGVLFSLSGGDSVQIALDEKKEVKVVAAIYAPGSKIAPSLKDIFGPDAVDATGDTYKMERYPDAGYWISYSRSNSQDKPIVVVTMRKIQ